MIFRQLFDRVSSTYTYLIADEKSKEAAIIDPVLEQVERDVQLIDELGLTLKFTLDTHVHADHVTGSGALRQRLGATSVASSAAHVACVSREVDQGERIQVGDIEIEARLTPGHTSGCVTYVVADGDKSMAFTGDALLIRGCGRTDFQQGDSHALFRSVREQIFTLPESTEIYPGHDYRGHAKSTVGEERKYNARLRDGISEPEFVQIMAALKLADPKQMDVAVPANLACGTRKEQDRPSGSSPAKRRIIDVREPAEFEGELGHLDGAELVPLSTLERAARHWKKETPLLVVCRGGGRSARACTQLERMGFTDVKNFDGGMLAHRATYGSCAAV